MTDSPVGRRLVIIVDEDATFEHKPLYSQIMQRALDAGLAGASVFRGIEGYGASRHLHTSRILSLTERLPVMIVIIDSVENVDRFLPQLDDLGVRGVVALDDVEIVRPGAGRPRATP